MGSASPDTGFQLRHGLGGWDHQMLDRRPVVCHDQQAIGKLAYSFIELMADLKANRIAHGDLQHGNILIGPDNSPTLLDYDGLCVPALVGRPSLEYGSPAYQHPGRKGRPLSLNVDDFSAWIILTSLRALAAEPGLWTTFVSARGQNHLLFCEDDLTRPSATMLSERSRLVSRPRRASMVPTARPRSTTAMTASRLSLRLPNSPTCKIPRRRAPMPPTGLCTSWRRQRSSSATRRSIATSSSASMITVLNAHGIDTWYSKDDIQTAARWRRTPQGLNGCEWFMVVMSQRSAQSEWVCDEVAWAIENRPGKIIPVLIQDCNIRDFHIRMARIQYVDYRTDWHAARRRLLAIWDRESSDAGP